MFSYGTEQATAWEREASRARLAAMPVEEVARRSGGTAARRSRGCRVRAIPVHFDVDVIDFVDPPLSENTGRNVGVASGGGVRRAGECPSGAAPVRVTVTELNPAHGADDGATLAAFVDQLSAAALGGSPGLVA